MRRRRFGVDADRPAALETAAEIETEDPVAPVTEDDLKRWAQMRLARYKCPRLFIQMDQLPRGANNKLLRRVLRADWEGQHGQA